MKRILSTLAAAAGLLTLVGGLQAQSYIQKARIPFAWQANGHRYSAGSFAIRKETNTAILLWSPESREAVFLLTSGDRQPGSRPELTFHRYGDQYFLAEIRALDGIGVKLHASRAEREIMAAGSAMATVQVDVLPAN